MPQIFLSFVLLEKDIVFYNEQRPHGSIGYKVRVFFMFSEVNFSRTKSTFSGKASTESVRKIGTYKSYNS